MTKAGKENEYSKIVIYKSKDRENKNKYQKEKDDEFTKQGTKIDGQWRRDYRNTNRNGREDMWEKEVQWRTKWSNDNIKELVKTKKPAWTTFIQTKDHAKKH